MYAHFVSRVLALLILTVPQLMLAKEPEAREFTFVYAGAVTELKPGTMARVWLPAPQNLEYQTAKRLSVKLPAKPQFTKDARWDNSLIYFEAKANTAGEIPLEIKYRVRRRPVTRGRGETASQEMARRFLAPNRLVPNEGVLDILFPSNSAATKSRISQVRTLYDQVDAHMRYDKPLNGLWGRGDALWACDSGFGNCSDFHSLFIASCRESGIPARFVMGFPIPELSESVPTARVNGYHCWAQCVVEDRWFSVDISEADKAPKRKDFYFGNLDPNRVAFTIGRDLLLVPKNATGPANFLIYPHVEVNGQTHTAFRKQFRATR